MSCVDEIDLCVIRGDAFELNVGLSDAFTEVIQQSGGLAQIGLELAVLTLYGVALLAAASLALRRAIVA